MQTYLTIPRLPCFHNCLYSTYYSNLNLSSRNAAHVTYFQLSTSLTIAELRIIPERQDQFIKKTHVSSGGFETGRKYGYHAFHYQHCLAKEKSQIPSFYALPTLPHPVYIDQDLVNSKSICLNVALRFSRWQYLIAPIYTIYPHCRSFSRLGSGDPMLPTKFLPTSKPTSQRSGWAKEQWTTRRLSLLPPSQQRLVSTTTYPLAATYLLTAFPFPKVQQTHKQSHHHNIRSKMHTNSSVKNTASSAFKALSAMSSNTNILPPLQGLSTPLRYTYDLFTKR
jgi:hypothetical protein